VAAGAALLAAIIIFAAVLSRQRLQRHRVFRVAPAEKPVQPPATIPPVEQWSDTFERLAPAKINLFLHVGPASADGYHPIVSLMAFADVGDFVRIEPSAVMGFDLEGPFAGALNSAPGNLVLAVRDLAIANQPGAWPPFKLTLDKQLPVAAGLGGGSADAAATLALRAGIPTASLPAEPSLRSR